MSTTPNTTCTESERSRRGPALLGAGLAAAAAVACLLASVERGGAVAEAQAAIAMARPEVIAAAAALAPERRAELTHLVLHDCGSCHGMTLGGGLGPAITPGAVEIQSSEALAARIRIGSPFRGMPPWEPLLSTPEIRWIADGLKNGVFVEASPVRAAGGMEARG